MRLPLALAFLVGLSGPTLGQDPADDLTSKALGAGGLPTAGDLSGFEPMQLTPDLYMDGLALCNGSLHVIYALELYDSVHDVSTPAHAFAVIEGGGQDGLDAYVYADGSGVNFVHYELDGIGSPSLTSDPLPSAPANASKLLAGDYDGDGKVDLFVLDANGTELSAYLDVASLSGPAVTNYSTASTDLLLAELDGTPALELVAVQGSSLVELLPNGVMPNIGTFLGPVTGLSRFRTSGSTRHTLVATYGNGGTDYLATFDANTSIQTVVSLGAIDVMGIAAADLNEDGLGDVFVLHRSSQDAWALFNTGVATAPFALTSPDWVSVPNGSGSAPLPASETATATTMDIDSDGDEEVLFSLSGSDAVMIAWNDAVDASTKQPVLVHREGSEDPTTFTRLEDPNAINTDGEFIRHYQAVYTHPLALDPSFTHIEVRTRRRAEKTLPLSPDLFDYRTQAFPNPGVLTTLTLTITDDEETTADYPRAVRYVEISGGEIVKVGPALLETFSVNLIVADELAVQHGLAESNNVPIFDTSILGWSEILYVNSTVDPRKGTGDTPVTPPPPIDDEDEPLPGDGTGN